MGFSDFHPEWNRVRVDWAATSLRHGWDQRLWSVSTDDLWRPLQRPSHRAAPDLGVSRRAPVLLHTQAFFSSAGDVAAGAPNLYYRLDRHARCHFARGRYRDATDAGERGA